VCPNHASSGDSISITVEATDASGVDDVGFDLLYDPETVSSGGYEVTGCLLEDWSSLICGENGGVISCGGGSESPLPEGSAGCLVQFHFEVLADLAGRTTELGIEEMAGDLVLMTGTSCFIELGCEGDLDTDGDVDGTDQAIFAEAYVTGDLVTADLDWSGTVDAEDLRILATQLGRTDCPWLTCSDLDGDGYGDPASSVCTFPEQDCDDTNAYVYPSARELCDGIDNQCEGDEGYGSIDEECFLDGLVAHYPFDGNADDVSGNENHGTGSGVSYEDGVMGQAASFDGIGDYISISENTNLDGFYEFSLSIWIKPHGSLNGSTERQDILYKGTRGVRESSYSLSYNGGNLGFHMHSEASWDPFADIRYAADFSTNAWFHVAITYDGISDVVMYVNGVESGADFSGGMSGEMLDVIHALTVGRRPDSLYYFNGAIDELIIYNRQLSLPEVQTLFNTWTGNDQAKTVFVTDGEYVGDLGGVAGADAICQTEADGAGLSGTYKAWLSDSINSPSQSFYRSSYPYVLMDGTMIAENWEDLTDGEITNPIYLTASGLDVTIIGSPIVWTNTKTDGSVNHSGGNNNCLGWTSDTVAGYYGKADHTDADWTQVNGGYLCSLDLCLYCFQQ